jgi:hypothetical protein
MPMTWPGSTGATKGPSARKKRNERTANVIENKGPVWKIGPRSWNVSENNELNPE